MKPTQMKLAEIVRASEELLNKRENQNWRKLWNVWADGLLENEKKIFEARKKFKELPPLRFYMPIGEAKDSKTSCRFAIRYFGIEVAEIETKFSDMIPYLSFDDTKDSDRRKNRQNLRLDMLEKKFLHRWDSRSAGKFRSALKDAIYPEAYENMLESMFLDEIEKSINNKFEGTLRNIQPVELYDKLRFQMKIPLSANKGIPHYSKYGGRIDILSRIGSSQNTNLAILELKKEDTKSYKKAIAQSLIYSIGILYLLRDEKMGKKWWKLFGFKRDLPASLTIYAAATIPYSIRHEFEKERIELGITDDTIINVGQDIIKCGHIFFEKNKNHRIEIKSVGGLDNTIFNRK